MSSSRVRTSIRLSVVSALVASMLVALAPAGSAATVFTVTGTGDGAVTACAANVCATLRDAIVEANANGNFSETDIINLPAGTIMLSGATGDDAAVSGDLDVTQSVKIQGAGSGEAPGSNTIITGPAGERILDVFGGVLELEGIRLADGGDPLDYGGGIQGGGSGLILTDVVMTGLDGSHGSAIWCRCHTLEMTDVTITNNNSTQNDTVTYEPNVGGGHATLLRTHIDNNTGDAATGFLANPSALPSGIYSVNITDSSVSGNTGVGMTGLRIAGNATANLTRVEVNNNETHDLFARAGLILGGPGFPGIGDTSLTDVEVNGNTSSAGGAGLIVVSTGNGSLTRVEANNNNAGIGDRSGINIDMPAWPDPAPHQGPNRGSCCPPQNWTITDVEVEGNQGDSQVGLTLRDSTGGHAHTLTNVTATANKAFDDDGNGAVGGVHIVGAGRLTVDGVTITGGPGVGDHGLWMDTVGTGTASNISVSGSQGPGLRVFRSKMDVSNGVFMDNVATHGGGVRMNQGRLGLTDVAIMDNVATHGGGIHAGCFTLCTVDSVSTVILHNTLVDGNVGVYGGGGILIDQVGTGQLVASNTQISNNRSGDAERTIAGIGGAIRAWSTSDVDLRFTTLSNNAAVNGNGGGVSFEGSDGTWLSSSILSNNTPSNCDVPGPASAGHNVADDDTCKLSAASDQESTDPELSEVAGPMPGPRRSVPAVAGATYLVPSADSPAVDISSAAPCGDASADVPGAPVPVGPVNLAEDMRGTTRPTAANPAVSPTACDAGAVERGASAVTISGNGATEGGATPVVVFLERSGDTTGTLDVPLLWSGTATQADIVDPLPASITFADGETTTNVSLGVVDDAVGEGVEILTPTIGPDLNAGGAGSSVDLEIRDNEVTVEEMAGKTRFETAAVLSASAFKDGAPVVVLARSDVYADALAAGPLAAALGGPVLLTSPTSLPEATADEIERLDPAQVIVAGGTSAVSESVLDQVKALGPTTRRLAGANRFETAVKIATELAADGPSDVAGRAYVTEGINADPRRGWPDALSVAPVAGLTHTPILLVSATTAPQATLDGIDALGITEVVAIGGTAAIGESVLDTLEAAAGTSDRIFGANRYATSKAVADHAVTQGASPDRTWFATGTGFADALVAGPVVALDGGSMLLVNGKNPDSFDTSPASTWLTTNADNTSNITFIGGVAAILQTVRDKVLALVA